ncbi:MAG: DUF4260 domain-containing protein [Microscillaceae bacterium]
MKILLKSEELASLALSILLYAQLDWAWYWYLVWFLAPDLGMVGYAADPRVGAYLYNLSHHKGLAIGLGMAGFFLPNPHLLFSGLLLFGHAALDRLFGYGLKYTRGFQYTHLVIIGKQKDA